MEKNGQQNLKTQGRQAVVMTDSQREIRLYKRTISSLTRAPPAGAGENANGPLKKVFSECCQIVTFV